MTPPFCTESPPIDTVHKADFSAAQNSTAGRKPQNEDAVGFFVPDEPLLTIKGTIAMIADGVSSAEAGKEASHQCVNQFIQEFYNTPELWSTATSAQKVLTGINRSLYKRSNSFRHLDKGYITTLSILILKSNKAHIFHIGDSRIYLIRDHAIEQLTTDHIATSGTETHYLTRAMGMDIGLTMDYRAIDIAEGDRFFLSTDGIHDFMQDQDILDAFHPQADVQQICQALTEKALHEHSDDNISCLALRVNTLALETKNQAAIRLHHPPFPPDLEPGMKLDGYRINALIFASTRCQIYNVTDEDTGTRLIMKTPSINFVDDDAYIESFITEPWVGSRFDHPNIVKVIANHGKKNFLYYLMENAEGITLDQWREQNKEARPKDLIKIIDQIAAGLIALHEKETIHQDLKPRNIMISPDGKVKIIDFGSVYVAGIAEIYSPVKHRHIIGTVNYSDPLYMLGKNMGVKGDIFSLASITYELFTQHLPYGNKLESFKVHLDTKRLKYIPSTHIKRDIPLWFDGALLKATEINPSLRYESIEAFMQDLKNPNPEFLTEAYILQHHKRFPTFKVWQALGLLWLASLLAAIIIFIT
ncbi:MAG: serine/threonine protein kinase [Moraxellaceae bacterium]|nr:MAG: serine/threonine protein kinase [Moraxellaceae bacterium]